MNAEIPPGLKDGIDPGAITIPQVRVEELEEAARAIKGDGQDVADTGNDITSAWGGLQGLYSAPEDDALFAAIDPVATKGDDVHTAADTVGDALLVFAEDVRPILQRWRGLKHDAQDMQDHIDANEEWDKDEDKVDELSQLNNDLIKVQNDFMAAERECANKITALFGGTTFVATDPGSEPNAGKGEKAYGYSEAPEDVATPWAIPQEHDSAWYVDVGSALWDIGSGTVLDATGMIGLHDGQGDWTLNPATMGDNAYQTWRDNLAGMGMLAGYGPDGFSWSTAGTALKEVAHSMVPWSEWEDRRGYVITQAVINIGSIVGGAALSFTGVGAAVGVPLMAWRGTRILRTLGNIGDLGPGSGSGAGNHGDSGSGSTDLGERLDFDLKLDGTGERDGAPTSQEIQSSLEEWEGLAEKIGWDDTLRLSADLAEEVEQRQPVMAGSGGPDIEANTNGPDDPPSTDPKPNPPSTDLPDPGPSQERPSNSTPNPSGEGGPPGGGNPPNGGGGSGGGQDRPSSPEGGGDDGDGDQDPSNPSDSPRKDPPTPGAGPSDAGAGSPPDSPEDAPEDGVLGEATGQDTADPDASQSPEEQNAESAEEEQTTEQPESGKPSLPDWLKERLEAGEEFNVERRPYYTERGGLNEVYVGERTSDHDYYRLDSYIPNQEIVSRKLTQFSEIKIESGLKHLNEFDRKYSPGTRIADVPSNIQNGYAGKLLRGKMILEVPVQKSPIPEQILRRAEDLRISIRDINGNVYKLPPESD